MLLEIHKSVGQLPALGSATLHPSLSPSGRSAAALRRTAERGFKLLQADYRYELSRVLNNYTYRRWALAVARRQARSTIRTFFAKAFSYGLRWQAGTESTPRVIPLTAEQLRWANRAADEEFGFFDRLLNQERVRLGRLRPRATVTRGRGINQPEGEEPGPAEPPLKASRYDWTERVANYVKSLTAIRDAGRVAALPDRTLIWWQLTTGAEHCRGCTWLQSISPLHRGNVPGTPRDGLCSCRHNCRCTLRTRQVTRAEFDRVVRRSMTRSRIAARLAAMRS